MKDATRLVTLGRHPERYQGHVSTPIFKTSTVLFDNVEDYESKKTEHGTTYGRHGTPTAKDLEEALALLEGGSLAVAVMSGMAAITVPMLSLLRAGDHILVVDTAYEPTRIFCDKTLARFGVSTTYYDPGAGAGIDALIRPETTLIHLESPGSLTFDVQDVPAIVDVGKRRGIVTMIDNTWASPLFFRPLDLGVDISCHAITKYIGGHSDIMLGAFVAADGIADRLQRGMRPLGSHASPEDCFLASRGLRTLGVRMARHQENALHVAHWLENRAEVDAVFYPALPSHPGHELWKRDFTGASGLFGVLLRPAPMSAVHAFVDGLELFGIGSSWGGYESLCTVTHPARTRTAVPWSSEGQTLRFHIGLEDPDDLVADLDAGFARFRAAA